MTLKRVRLWLILTVTAFLLEPNPSHAQPHFYQGKTINILQSRSPGGTGDGYVRSMIPFLEKYIPGNPNIVTEYMPGAGGRTQANHMYGTARPDGLTVGSGTGGIITNGILDTVGVRYQLDKFIYLGSPRTETQQIFVTRRDAGLGSLEKLRTIPGIRIGDQSVGFTTYVDARLFAYLIGLKEPKFVVGYSGREVDLALIHGEVDARSTPIHNILTRNRDWVEKKLVDFHAVIEFPKGKSTRSFRTFPISKLLLNRRKSTTC